MYVSTHCKLIVNSLQAREAHKQVDQLHCVQDGECDAVMCQRVMASCHGIMSDSLDGIM